MALDLNLEEKRILSELDLVRLLQLTLQLVTNSGVTLKSSISERRISCISVTHRPPIWVLEFQLAIFPFWIGFGPRRFLV